MTKTRISLSSATGDPPSTGWEYKTVFGGSVRVFDNGNKAWYFNSPKVRYVVHFRNNPMVMGHYNVRVNVPNFDDPNRTIEFDGYGNTRREAFTEVRRQISDYRSACRKVSHLKSWCGSD